MLGHADKFRPRSRLHVCVTYKCNLLAHYFNRTERCKRLRDRNYGISLYVDISVRVLQLPFPGTADNRLEIGVARSPAELCHETTRAGTQDGRISWATLR